MIMFKYIHRKVLLASADQTAHLDLLSPSEKYMTDNNCDPSRKKGTLLELLDKITKTGTKQAQADRVR